MQLPPPTPSRFRRLVGVAFAAVIGLLMSAVPAYAQEDTGLIEGLCPVDPPEIAFEDRAEISQVHRGAVDCLVYVGVVEGRPVQDGPGALFLPDDAVRRDQMASFLIRGLEAAGHDVPEPDGAVFDDVPSSNVHADNVGSLAAIDVTTGVEPDRYAPAQHVSRAQMATFLLRTFAYAQDEDVDELTIDEPAFADTEGLFHQPFIAGAAEQGIVEGVTETRYGPAADVSREQMATFVTRLIDRVFTFDSRCENSNAGYAVSYPSSWSVNDGDVNADCTVFDPSPFDLDEGTEIPAGLAIRFIDSDASYDEATTPGESEDFASTEETTVAGQDATIVVARSTGGLLPEGTLSYRYVIDTPDGTLIASTIGVDDNRYDLSQQVLDEMMESLEFI